MLCVNLLNFLVDFKSDVKNIEHFANVSVLQHDMFQVTSAKLFRNNQISSCCCEYSDGKYTFHDTVDTSADFSVMITFNGTVRMSLLIRPKGTLRISTQFPDYVQNKTSCADELETYVYMLCDICEELFSMEIMKEKYYILLMNGVYYTNHGFNNTLQDYEYIKSSGRFAKVVAASNLPGQRRQGTIKMYMHASGKCGVVKINKRSFHLMGFTKLNTLEQCIHNLDMLILLK